MLAFQSNRQPDLHLVTKRLHVDHIETAIYHPESLDIELETMRRWDLSLYPLGSGGISSVSRKIKELV